MRLPKIIMLLRVLQQKNKKEILDKGEEYFHELYEIIDDHLNL